MNRTIKFRGKRVDTGECVYGDLIHGQGPKYGKMYILPQTHIYPKGCSDLDGWNVIPETVGQFTGLLDKDGKEIYEGDIVRIGTESFGWANGKSGFVHYEIKHQGCDFILHILDLNRKWGRLSRIEEIGWEVQIKGNIHDNPELLEEKA